MKKQKWLYWIVAIILVFAAGYSVIAVHHAERKNAVKMQSDAKIVSKVDRKKARLIADQKARQRDPIDWNKSSLTGDYPDLSPYRGVKSAKFKVWLDVSVRKQRVYVMVGQYRLYTMYASIGKNYEKTKGYQRTPEGTFKLQKRHGTSYFDATKGYGAKYWTSFDGKGVYRFESVPFDHDGHVIKSEAKRLGQRSVTNKHNIKNYGSIRLTVADAKWLQENIWPKTRVVIHDRKTDKNYLDFLY